MPVGCFPDVETHCCGLVTLVTLQVRERFTHVVEGVHFPRFFFLEVAAQESLSLECDVPIERSPINSGQKGWLGSPNGICSFLGVSDLACLCFSRLLGSSCLMAGSSGGSQVSGYHLHLVAIICERFFLPGENV